MRGHDIDRVSFYHLTRNGSLVVWYLLSDELVLT